jgi:prepilin-type N-terminal cleavage/methylation domain-containing protein
MRKTIINNTLIKNSIGFSLIEVVMAMGVFAVGALTVSTLLVSSFQNNRQGNIITQATMLAESKMEDLKSTSDITLLADEDESNIDQNGQPGGTFTRTARITNPLGGNFSRQIEITVRWTNKSRVRRVVLTSFSHGNGI